MPHHRQFEKSLRQDTKRNAANRTQRARLRGAIRGFRALTDVKAAEANLPEVVSLVDRGAKTHLIHPSTAKRLKSRLALALNRLRAGQPTA
jgi:ribosomal protein S20